MAEQRISDAQLREIITIGGDAQYEVSKLDLARDLLAARELLRELQYASDDGPYCIDCGRARCAPDCRLAALIGGVE